MKLVSKLALFATVLIALASCKTVEVLPDPEPEPFDPDKGKVKGFYLLNEGPMGANKATLDYCSLADGTYTKDIFAKKNPALVQGLGDVGNDVKAYGNKLYTVVNNSNLVEISDLTTGMSLYRSAETLPSRANMPMLPPTAEEPRATNSTALLHR